MVASGEPHHVNVGVAVPRAHPRRMTAKDARTHTIIIKREPDDC